MNDDDQVIDVDATFEDDADDAKPAEVVDVSKAKEVAESARNELTAIKEEMAVGKMENCINGVPLPTFIFQRFVNRLDPIEYCQNVLRDHYPEEKRFLHSNQIEFIRAACNPKVRRTAALMARQCLPEDAMIHTRDGRVVRIADHPNAWLTRRNAEILEIHAHGGHTLRCTANHPVCTQDGWRPAGELKVGDRVVCMYAWSRWSTVNVDLSPDACELMGMLSSTTHVSLPTATTLRVVRNSRAVMTRLRKLLSTVAPSAKVRYPKRDKGVMYITLDKTMKLLVKRFGEPGKVNIATAGALTREQTCAYLRGVYNMCVTVAPVEGQYVMYNADANLGENPAHAAIVRELLLKLGVRARVKLTSGKWHIVRFKGEANRRVFADVVGPLLRCKFPDGDAVRGVKFFQGEDDEQLYMSRVTSIKSCGTADVYDVTYPNKGWFIAGGFKVHNSGKTESVASICGYLCDNYPQMRVGVFTPRLQQAETDIGRMSLFYQMNEQLLNNQIVSLNKDKVELSNKSYAMAVSASDQSNIEGYTFDVIILDEAQKVSNYTWSERIVPMGGACVTGDSVVTLADGAQVRIDELVHSERTGYFLPCVDITTGKLMMKPVVAVHDVGLREVMKITLASGRTVEGTYGHPVVTYSRRTRKWAWTRLENVHVGDRVGVAAALPCFGLVHEIDARLVGMLVGDGNYTDTVRFCNADDALWDYIAMNYPDAMPTKYMRTEITKDGRRMRIGTLYGMQPLTRRMGIAGQVGLNKRLPKDWSTWDEWSLCELIAGLWDTDGYVNVESDRCSLGFCTICREIADDVQMILQRLGVLAKVSMKKGHKSIIDGVHEVTTKDHYLVTVRDKAGVEMFARKVQLLTSYKKAALCRALQVFAEHKHKIPKNLLNVDLRFDRVVNVEKTGIKNVYDLTVADYHSFVANGVFVHNTNAKLIKVGTPKTRNHFYDCVEGKASVDWKVFRRDWTQCPQLWALDSIMLPDKDTGEMRPYSTFVMAQMPKALKEWYFPNNPEVWTEGSMDIIDFRTQYMLEFIDGAGTYLSKDQVEALGKGEFEWMERGVIGERYVAGIDFAGSNPDGDSTHISVLRVNPDGSKHKVFAKEFIDTPYPQQMYEIARLFGGYTPVFAVDKIFADYTGCGAAVVQTLRDEYGLTMIEGIIFNQSDRFTNSGMNMKNIMYAKFLQTLDAGKFSYPSAEKFAASPLASAGKMNVGFYHKMIGEWSDLEVITGHTVNKKIQAPKGYHDDVCDADVLANFTTIAATRSRMPRPAFARVHHW